MVPGQIKVLFSGSLDLVVLEVKGMEVTPSTPSWHGIHTGSQNLTYLFLEVDTILLTFSASIWWHITLIQSWVSVETF